MAVNPSAEGRALPKIEEEVGSPNRSIHRTFRAIFAMPEIQSSLKLLKIGKRQYRNPIYLAKEWQDALNSGQFASLADLARYYKISRARVTQIMNLLDLVPEVVDRIAALGNPLVAPVITERNLRSLLGLSIEEQKARIICMLSRR